MARNQHNRLSRDDDGVVSQFVAFSGAKHFSPLTKAGDVKLIAGGATNFSRTWLVIHNPSGGQRIWLGYEDDVTSADTDRQGMPIEPGNSWAGVVGKGIDVYVYCAAAQRLNCQELG